MYYSALLFITVFLHCSENSVNPKNTGPYVDPRPLESEPLEVLFIGNSLSEWNEMTYTFKSMADSTDKNINVESAIIFGASLTDHLGHTATTNKIREKNWDYVIVQGGNYGIALEEYRDAAFSEIKNMHDLIKENNRSTNVVLFLDYALGRDVTADGETYFGHAQFEEMIYEGTKIISDSLNMLIAPVGRAWSQVFTENSELNLYDEDELHPSVYGSYLMACVYYSTIFREQSSGINVCPGITEDVALYLQRVATATVLDNLSMWNL